jgi:hypothetical protein
MPPFASKPGAYGTLYLFVISYTDRYDPCCPIMTWSTWAYDAEHAEERFYAADDEGWTVVGRASRKRAA